MDGESFHSSSFNIGDIIEEADVLRLDQSKGLLLQLNDELLGYAHVSKDSERWAVLNNNSVSLYCT